MREFFKGWRRKVGCGALVITLAVVALWSWSYRVNDIAMLAVGDRQHEFSSIEGIILWRSWRPVGKRPFDDYERIPVAALNRVASVKGVDWMTRFDNSDTSRIHYWSLALPLTLLSAYLILWKPRKPKEPTCA